ncbi:MAG: COX15/CtaA family protein [Xanthomonadales bacterium]|nr:COX15/CtaA family protein [Xanthomonadales bacterium]
MNRAFSNWAWLGAALALTVVILGAYVRLSHAGLGCPDWPVCYGKATWPVTVEEVAAANRDFPERPVEVGKAWREQVHRFLAAGLGTLILGLALAASWNRRARRNLVLATAAIAMIGVISYVQGLRDFAGMISILAVGLPVSLAFFWRDDPRAALATGLLGLVIFQAMLGMWTVTLLLKPIVVTAHLLGGLATLGLLVWLAMRTRERQPEHDRSLRGVAWLALVAVAGQIFLGGWTSTNYAALACPDLPMCQGQWWPEMDFGEAFVLWRGIGVDYEGGILDWPARTAIQFSHRLGAIALTLVLAYVLWRLSSRPRFRGHALVIGSLLALQIGLGIWNVLGSLPLPVAVAHNAGAALLLIAVLLLFYRTTHPEPT